MLVTDAARQQLGRAALAMVGWSYLGYAYTLRTLPAFHPPLCPFLALTGIPCPLCGTTRAWDATLHGDLAAAFRYHPLAPLALPLWIVATLALTLGVDRPLQHYVKARLSKFSMGRGSERPSACTATS
jgi:hypothetical protein